MSLWLSRMILFSTDLGKFVLPHMMSQELCTLTSARLKYWETICYHIDLILYWTVRYAVVDLVGSVKIYASNCATPFATINKGGGKLTLYREAKFATFLSNPLFL